MAERREPAPAPVARVFALIEEDMNGDHFLGNQEGEKLLNIPANTYVFHGLGNFSSSAVAAHDPAWGLQFLANNAAALRNANIEIREAMRVAYLRLLAVQDSLVWHDQNPNDFHVDYAEVRTVQQNVAPDEKFQTAAHDYLALPWRQYVRERFVDIVSLVAFVFRSRGHHYLASYQELYERVWQKCRYDVAQLGLSFERIATNALHAIFPMVLDKFWLDNSQENKVNGALSKRVDCAPAGNAGPYVVLQGAQDLMLIAPGIRDRVSEAQTYLERHISLLQQHRFNGSVNARYYGAERMAFDERKVAAIAATVRASLEGLAPSAPLLGSAALKRIAGNAPITGAVLAHAIQGLPEHPGIISGLLQHNE